MQNDYQYVFIQYDISNNNTFSSLQSDDQKVTQKIIHHLAKITSIINLFNYYERFTRSFAINQFTLTKVYDIILLS